MSKQSIMIEEAGKIALSLLPCVSLNYLFQLATSSLTTSATTGAYERQLRDIQMHHSQILQLVAYPAFAHLDHSKQNLNAVSQKRDIESTATFFCW